MAIPNSLALDITGPLDVFSCANKWLNYHGNKLITYNYDVMVVSATKQTDIVTNSGLTIACCNSIYDIQHPIDTLLVAGFSADHNWKKYPELVSWLATKIPGIRRVCSVCIGAFVLAETGILKGKQATTHWHFCQQLREDYEDIKVDPNPIFVKDGKLYTSAGASAGIDLALALVEEDFGRKVSLQIAQTLVLYFKRSGNQMQFSNLLSQQLSSKKPIKELQLWIIDNLKTTLDVESLAERISMSPRNFARVFLIEVGVTPAKYIEKMRIETSKRYLEETTLSLDVIAENSGFGSTDTMRKIFVKHFNTTPSLYRSFFGTF